MTKNGTSSPRKKRLITKKNRSAWVVSIILISLMALRLVAGMTRTAVAAHKAAAVSPTAATVASTSQDMAASALDTFFNLLVEKRYAEATTHFGGSYADLAAAFPQDAADEAHLLQDACDQTPCLPIHSVINTQADGSDRFTFTVTFAGADGRLRTQTAADGRQITQFDITVVHQNGRYLVQNLP